jgi:5'-AMP-activated protein kinase catalytic alpha subunit
MNIKIVDFGLSNTYKNANDTLKTACGSPCYASPEMIAGKRYSGLDTDIWSLGVILYAMTVGYLPFEDPDTNKLYKKILSCDYLVPGYVTKPAKDMMKKILQVDPKKRYKIDEIKKHPWYMSIQQTQLDGIVVGKDKIPVLNQIQIEMESNTQVKTLDGLDKLTTMVEMNKHNPLTATYYLLIKKYERNTD